jgi:hypothetical protein
MSNFLDEDKVVIMRVPLYVKMSVILMVLVIICDWGSHSYWYWKGVLFLPFVIVYAFFTKYIIHGEGIDLLLGIVDYKMKYHGFLIDHFDWNEIKVVLVNKKIIQLINVRRNKCNVRRKKWTSLSSLYMQLPIGTGLANYRGLYLSPIYQTNFKHAVLVIQKYGRYHLSQNERKIFDEELEKRYFATNSLVVFLLYFIPLLLFIIIYYFN